MLIMTAKTNRKFNISYYSPHLFFLIIMNFHNTLPVNRNYQVYITKHLLRNTWITSKSPTRSTILKYLCFLPIWVSLHISTCSQDLINKCDTRNKIPTQHSPYYPISKLYWTFGRLKKLLFSPWNVFLYTKREKKIPKGKNFEV